jgi:hypothetical protein
MSKTLNGCNAERSGTCESERSKKRIGTNSSHSRFKSERTSVILEAVSSIIFKAFMLHVGEVEGKGISSKEVSKYSKNFVKF